MESSLIDDATVGKSSEEILATLRSTPTVLSLVVSPVDAQYARTRLKPARWSIVEKVMPVRARRMIEEDFPLLDSYDQNAECENGAFIRRDLRAEIERFTEMRMRNLGWLGTLGLPDWQRRGRHADLGEVSVSDLLHEWAMHDLGHIRQVLEIRRARFWNRAGAFQSFYVINP
jgi:hypothetical protein